jgi:uncharacterized protein (DUF952 family)
VDGRRRPAGRDRPGKRLKRRAPEVSSLVYHIATTADWELALADGEYRTSTRGKSLADEGFIHASTARQVAAVANAFYRGATDLLILVIDPDLVESDIRYEQAPGTGESFPHIYGPLSVGAVIAALPLEPDPDGRFRFTAD